MKKIIFPLILILAFGLRFWHFTDYFVFSLEEMNILYTIEKFVTGNWSFLLGPEATGYVHHLFLPPWYLYLFSVIYKLSRGEPLVIGYIHITVGVISVLFWYLIGRRFKNLEIAVVAAFLSAVSFNLITVDRSAWAAGLIPFVTTVMIYIFISAVKTKKTIYLLILGFLLGFSLSLHYQSLILLFAVLLGGSYFFNKKVIYIIVPFLLSLTPLLVFDFRHHFFNIYGFFLAVKAILSGGSPYSSNHYFYFLYPFLIFLAAWLLAKIPKPISIFVLIIYFLVQMRSFELAPAYRSYFVKSSLVSNILDNYHNQELRVFFKGRDSYEYKYLLFQRARSKGIDTNKIFIFEPWQSSSSAQLIIESDKIFKP